MVSGILHIFYGSLDRCRYFSFFCMSSLCFFILIEINDYWRNLHTFYRSLYFYIMILTIHSSSSSILYSSCVFSFSVWLLLLCCFNFCYCNCQWVFYLIHPYMNSLIHVMYTTFNVLTVLYIKFLDLTVCMIRVPNLLLSSVIFILKRVWLDIQITLRTFFLALLQNIYIYSNKKFNIPFGVRDLIDFVRTVSFYFTLFN